jgi:alpha-L-arabinofuranosidase
MNNRIRPTFFSYPRGLSLGFLAVMTMGPTVRAQDSNASSTLALELVVTGQTLPARAALYGHNMTAGDWHGNTSNYRAPILWDPATKQPDPAWSPLTHAWPLRALRYHSGNAYPWRDAVGPVAERQVIRDDYRRSLRTDAGLQEFLQWRESLATVGTQAPDVILIASPFRPVQELADLVAYCNATSDPMAELRSVHGHPAPYNVRYWELGNETDWINRDDLDLGRAETEREKKNKLLVSDYVALCRERVLAMRAVDPSIMFIAHAQTAPWPSSNPHWREWHREVIRGLGDLIDAIAIHPYYDGHKIPYVLASIDALIADIRELQPPGRNITVAITEHSRWVNYKNEAERPQSWGMQGAISAGDFLLRVMNRPEVSSANYWCYLHRGPWRVLNANWEEDGSQKFGTGPFYLFQLLNEAVLPRFELLTTVPLPSNGSSGYSYQVTAAHFSNPDNGTHSIVAVNRSADTPAILTIRNLPLPTDRMICTVVTADSLQATNVPATPDAVHLETRVIEIHGDDQPLFELPPRSIASWRWSNPATTAVATVSFPEPPEPTSK